jgi:phosphatidylinositol alpha-1,6-mannosyltransferase
VRHAVEVRYRVLTLGAPGLPPEPEPGDTRRLSVSGPWPARLARLNATAVAEARNWGPDVVLSGHIVTAPGAYLTRLPVVQYLYAKEVAHRPRLTTFAVRRARASIVLGEHGHTLAVAAGADPRRIHAIPPGIDLPARPTTTPRERGASIVNVARLEDRYKGFDILIRALPLIRARVPDATLTLVGAGQLQPSLEALARANGCRGALRCLGGVGDAERDELLSTASVFAMPGRLPAGSGGEGFGIVYLEAGARGTPVVAGNAGGARDAVVDGQTGLLVDPEDHRAVAEAIAGLLIDRELATRLGKGGREWAELFAWPAVTSRVEAVLAKAAASR